MANKSTMSQAMDVGGHAMQQAAETMGDTIVQVLDKLAGTKSDLKLTFDDLRLDAMGMSARLNGAIVLDVMMAKEA